jgi:hypothetical protein
MVEIQANKTMRKAILMLAMGMLFASSAAQSQTDTSRWKETPDGIVFGPGDPNLKISPNIAGATFLKKYQSYKPQTDANQDRARNREVVKRFFEMPIGEAAARLYGPDGNKQLPSMGVQWRGLPNLIKNNEQNSKLFGAFKWTDIVVWDTQDPSVFWVECQGSQRQEGTYNFSSHYLLQFVIKNAKIEILKEFTTPFAQGVE